MRRAVDFDESLKNPRPIIIMVSNALDKILILLSAVEMKFLCNEENLFIESTDTQRTDFGANLFVSETTFFREKGGC